MADLLSGKKVLLGVTGSIACYKAVDLASKLTQAGAQVDVVLTESAARFVTPLTFRAITHRPVVTDLFAPESEHAIEHVALAVGADILVVAPATAHTIARLAMGLADDSLGAIALATTAPLLVAPAMDANMYDHPSVRDHLDTLRRRGAHIAGPEAGRLASGLTGMGRMQAPETLVGQIKWVLGRKGDLVGRKVVVSAGGTQEPMDPVRMITNRSSGKMGYAIAEAARDRGAEVVLVTAASLPNPVGIECCHVATVADMREAVLGACVGADALIMAAAVSDYRPAEVGTSKMKKQNQDGGGMVLHLVKNADFFLEVPEGVMRIGFAAETEDLLANARVKLASKDLAFIAANDVTAPDSGFNVDTNRVTILDRDGGMDELPLLSKYDVGVRILDRMEALLLKRGKGVGAGAR